MSSEKKRAIKHRQALWKNSGMKPYQRVIVLWGQKTPLFLYISLRCVYRYLFIAMLFTEDARLSKKAIAAFEGGRLAALKIRTTKPLWGIQHYHVLLWQESKNTTCLKKRLQSEKGSCILTMNTVNAAVSVWIFVRWKIWRFGNRSWWNWKDASPAGCVNDIARI